MNKEKIKTECLEAAIITGDKKINELKGLILMLRNLIKNKDKKILELYRKIGELITENNELKKTNLSLTKPDIDLSLRSNNFAYDEDSTTGLNFYYKNGRVVFGTTCSKTSASYVTLTDNDDNYIESTTGGSISANVEGFTAGRIPLFVVTTSSGEITDVVDHRALLGTYLPYVYNQDLETTDNV